MTIYVNKEGTQLMTGSSFKGNAASFNLNVDKIEAHFPGNNGTWQARYFPLGVTLDETTDLFAKFKFESTSDILDLSDPTKLDFAYFGLMNSGSATHKVDALSALLYVTPLGGGNYRVNIGVNARNSILGSFTNTVNEFGVYADSTYYYFTLSYKASTKRLTVEWKDSDENVLSTNGTTIVGTFDVDSIGFWGQDTVDVNQFNQPFNITLIKANSGTTEESITTPSNTQPATPEGSILVSRYNVGCCNVQSIAYNSGVAQSLTTTELPFMENVTHLRVDVLMSRTADFDGDIEVKLYTDLLAGEELVLPHPIFIENSDIDIDMVPTEYVVALDIEVCEWQIAGRKIYISFTPTGATSGAFRIISTTPYSDKYSQGDKYLSINNVWTLQLYQDMCMKLYTKSDCEELGWCEYKYVDYLRCARALVKIDLPGFGIVAGKIADHAPSKDANLPYSWIPFNMVLEEIDIEQLNC